MIHVQRTLLTLLFFSCSFPLSSQTVHTLVNSIGAPRIEAITLNHNGYLYTLSGQGGFIYKIDAATGSVTTIGSGFSGPLGGAVDADTNFYFSAYNQGRIYKVKPDDSYTLFASGFSGPTGLVVGPSGDTLYVSNYNNNSISKVALGDSSVHSWIQGNGINGPDGLVFDSDNNLYIANFDDNRIHKVDSNDQITQFAALSQSSNSGYITLVDSTFYICGFFSNRIHAIDMTGNDTVIAGTGLPGYMDGPASQAEFYRPNGIARSPSGDSLYITGGTPIGKIRILDLKGVPSGANDQDKMKDTFSLMAAPNPVRGRTTLHYQLPYPAQVEISMIDPSGKRIDRMDMGQQIAGPHSVVWNTEASSLPAGNYQVILEAGKVKDSISVVVLQ